MALSSGKYRSTYETENHQTEVFGRSELKGELGQRGRKSGNQKRGHAPGKEAAEGSDAKRRTCASPFGHHMSVQAGDDGRCFAGYVDQNSGG